MKNPIIILSFVLALSSCKESNLSLQNNISQVVITDIYWGEINIGNQLMPGESAEKELSCQYTDFPINEKVRFIMHSGNKSIYLETKNSYYLDCDGSLNIVLDDNTEILNPNQ